VLNGTWSERGRKVGVEAVGGRKGSGCWKMEVCVAA
jgi:hypothetical protein